MCSAEIVRGTDKFTDAGSSTRAKILRGRRILATGASVPTAHGELLVVHTDRRLLGRGTYTLILRHPQAHHCITQRLRVVVR